MNTSWGLSLLVVRMIPFESPYDLLSRSSHSTCCHAMELSCMYARWWFHTWCLELSLRSGGTETGICIPCTFSVCNNRYTVSCRNPNGINYWTNFVYNGKIKNVATVWKLYKKVLSEESALNIQILASENRREVCSHSCRLEKLKFLTIILNTTIITDSSIKEERWVLQCPWSPPF